MSTKERHTPKRILMLRTVSADGCSHDGFRWPLTEGAEVEATDWNPEPVCGGGLHGLLWGEGDGTLLDWSEGAQWLVIEAALADVVEIGSEKAKCRRATVRHVGDRLSATTYLLAHGCAGRAVVGATLSAGVRGTATAGYYGTATAGHAGTATAGDYGTATAGYAGTATAGYAGTATAGDYGTATAGYAGTATAGYYGTLLVRWRDGVRFRITVGYVGEGIEPRVAYRCNERGELVQADQERER